MAKEQCGIPGATSSSDKTPKATAADNGSTYRVVVTNAASTVSSNSATLTVR